MGASNKRDVKLSSVLCIGTDSRLYQGCQNTEGGMGEFEEVFHRKHHDQEVAAHAGAQQHPIEGEADVKLHIQDQGNQ